MPGGNSRHSIYYPPYPVYAAYAKGCRITDVDGVTRLDCVNNMSALIHGHGNAAVLKAITTQAARLVCAGAPTAVEVDLAEALCARLPFAQQIRFTNSGSEAVMFACRVARAYTGRSKIAKVEGAYHGSYDGVAFGLNPGPDQWGKAECPAVTPATQGVTDSVAADTIVLPFNDVDATRTVLRAHRVDLAGVLIDPLVTRMGFMAASSEYLEFVRQFTADNNSLLIFDEVFSFRIGYHGAQGEVAIEPDLTALGKVIGGGLPIGAVAGREVYMSLFNQLLQPVAVAHSGTFFANPMSMAAGKAALDQLTPAVMARLNDMGLTLREKLEETLSTYGVEGYVAGAGSLCALILGTPKPTNYRQIFSVMAGGALEKGLKLHRFLLNARVQIIPPGGIVLSTAMNQGDIEEIVSAVREALGFIRKTTENSD